MPGHLVIPLLATSHWIYSLNSTHLCHEDIFSTKWYLPLPCHDLLTTSLSCPYFIFFPHLLSYSLLFLPVLLYLFLVSISSPPPCPVLIPSTPHRSCLTPSSSIYFYSTSSLSWPPDLLLVLSLFYRLSTSLAFLAPLPSLLTTWPPCFLPLFPRDLLFHFLASSPFHSSSSCFYLT